MGLDVYAHVGFGVVADGPLPWCAEDQDEDAQPDDWWRRLHGFVEWQAGEKYEEWLCRREAFDAAYPLPFVAEQTNDEDVTVLLVPGTHHTTGSHRRGGDGVCRFDTPIDVDAAALLAFCDRFGVAVRNRQPRWLLFTYLSC